MQLPARMRLVITLSAITCVLLTLKLASEKECIMLTAVHQTALIILRLFLEDGALVFKAV